jgi:hypothetical protein
VAHDALRPWHPAWPGFSARGSLLLALAAADFADLPAALETAGLGLARKREFHVTLLDRRLGASMHAPAAAGALAARLPGIFESLDWRWRRRGERWLLLEARPRGPVHSVVELIEMPAFGAFRAAIGEALGETLPDAPAHVTVYVAGDPRGIGIASHADFERLRLRRL